MLPGQEAQPDKASGASGNTAGGTDGKVRLNKFLAERLGVSRRQADDLIAAGKVLVRVAGSTEKKPAVLGARIDKTDEVWYNNSMVPFETEYFYVALNKPAGYVCSRKRQGDSPTIYEILPQKYASLKTVGRLDRDSSGLILLTNDGDFAFSMTHPKFYKEKVYEVELDRDLEPLHQQMIADFGVDLPDGKSQLGLSRIDGGSSNNGGHDGDRKRWRVTMSEGRNRQIRRTFAAVGYTVVGLHRVQFGKYQLSGLKPGDFTEVKKV